MGCKRDRAGLGKDVRERSNEKAVHVATINLSHWVCHGTLIFRGSGKRITRKEMGKYDARIKVMWQAKGWTGDSGGMGERSLGSDSTDCAEAPLLRKPRSAKIPSIQCGSSNGLR